MAEDEIQTIELKTKKEIIDHIREEPRFFFMAGKTDATEELLENLKGKHNKDLHLKLTAGNKHITVDIVEVGGYVSIRGKWIEGRNWRHYYGLKFRKKQDGSLVII